MRIQFKHIMALVTTLFCVAANAQSLDSIEAEVPHDRVDTIYYNRNWKVTRNKTFASFYRFALYPAEISSPKEFKTYYITGELQGEGEFEHLDPTDDTKSVFAGCVTTYYRDKGAIQTKGTYISGKLCGEWTEFYPDGKIREHCIMADGKRDGLCVSFTEDGTVCTVTPYAQDGETEDYYAIIDINGNYSKYSISDKTLLLETPKPDEIKTEYRNGTAWPYYNKNGIIVGVSNSMTDYVGDYREIGIFIVNKSMANIDIDPARINVYSVKNGKRKDYKLVEADEYDKKIMKVKKRNAKRVVKNKAVVEKERENNVNANLGAKVFDAGTSNTLKEFQKHMCDMKTLDDDTHMRYAEKLPEDLGYLERTTVHPGEIISGYLYTSDRKATDLFVNVQISGIDYLFEWK